MEHLAASTRCGEYTILDVWSAGSTNLSDYKFLAASICPACRKVEVRPLKRNTSDEIGRFLLEQVFTPIFPGVLISDRGTSVSAGHVTELLAALNAGVVEHNSTLPDGKQPVEGIRQKLSTSYYPLSHSAIERFFSTFAQSLRRLIREYPQNWQNYAGRIAAVINHTKCRATGFSPNQLHNGITPEQAYPDVFSLLSKSPEMTRSEFVNRRCPETLVARDMAYRNQEHYFNLTDKDWEKKHVTRLRDHRFTEGMFVLVKRMSRTGKNAPKLSPIPAYLGPGLIIKLIGKKALLIKFIINGEVRIRNYKHLYPFNFPETDDGQQEKYSKYFNGPGNRSSTDKNKHLITKLLDGSMDQDSDEFDPRSSDFMKTGQVFDFKRIQDNFKAELIPKEEVDSKITQEDMENDIYKDDYDELTQEELHEIHLESVQPDDDELDNPSDQRDISQEIRDMFGETQTKESEDEPDKFVSFDTETQVKTFDSDDVLDIETKDSDYVEHLDGDNKDSDYVQEVSHNDADLPAPRRSSRANRGQHDYKSLHATGF